MTVDIKTLFASDTSSTVLLESDICLDDGTIVAPGPSATFDASSRDFEADLSSWSEEFDVFLNASEVDAVTALHEMISKKNKNHAD